MGTWHILINIDKKEKISFSNVDTGLKLRELSGTAIAGSIVTCYLLNNVGDKITFINDSDEEFFLFGEKYKSNSFTAYREVTDEIVSLLLEQGVYKQEGIIIVDKEDNLFYKNLVNIWDPKFPWNK
ncbi:MAG TPA: hypothetical protein VEC12_01070 [Bacteroidia bacterium]|nr:hypothetical protein [Bacteroidia bacterium]